MVALRSAGLRVHRHILQLTLKFHSLKQKRRQAGKIGLTEAWKEAKALAPTPAVNPHGEKSTSSM